MRAILAKKRSKKREHTYIAVRIKEVISINVNGDSKDDDHDDDDDKRAPHLMTTTMA